MRYRKRPLEVEAEQWFPGKQVPGVKLFPGEREIHAYVTTIQEQQIPIKAGEWVIQEGDGVHAYPCDPTVFEKIYEPVKGTL